MAKRQPENKRAALAIDKFVGGRIRMERIALNMSQEKLGEQLGITFQQIQKYERGVNRVSAGRLLQIANILGKPMQFFVDEPQATAAKLQDAVMTQMLNSTGGREIATNYLAASEAGRAQIRATARFAADRKAA